MAEEEVVVVPAPPSDRKRKLEEVKLEAPEPPPGFPDGSNAEPGGASVDDGAVAPDSSQAKRPKLDEEAYGLEAKENGSSAKKTDGHPEEEKHEEKPQPKEDETGKPTQRDENQDSEASVEEVQECVQTKESEEKTGNEDQHSDHNSKPENNLEALVEAVTSQEGGIQESKKASGGDSEEEVDETEPRTRRIEMTRPTKRSSCFRNRVRDDDEVPYVDIHAIMHARRRRDLRRLHPKKENGAFWFGIDEMVGKSVSRCIKDNFKGPYYNWMATPERVRTWWWSIFAQTWFWEPENGDIVYTKWKDAVMKRLKSMINKQKAVWQKDPASKNVRPYWIKREIWDQMVEHWSSPAFLERSKKAAKSRKTEVAPNMGCSRHTSGSRPFSKVKYDIEKEKGEEASLLEVLQKTHRRRDGSYIDGKAKQIAEEVERKIAQCQRSETQALVNDVYMQTVQPNRSGRIYGLGSLHVDIVGGAGDGAPSSAHEIVTLMRRMQQLEEKRVEDSRVRQEQAEQIQDQAEQIKLLKERCEVMQSMLDLVAHDQSVPNGSTVAEMLRDRERSNISR